MRSTIDTALEDQRLTLRRRMLAQRQLIAYQVEPIPRAHRDSPVDTSPRAPSWRPAVYAGVISGLASFVIGARYIGAIMAALAVTRMVRGVARHAEPEPPTVGPTEGPPA
jgi:hypothetical protein